MRAEAPRVYPRPPMLPLSQSPLWDRQRTFYSERASAAFAEIPHQAVDNPWVAAAYAQVVAGFLRDHGHHLVRAEPLYVLELGSGPGRFAFHLRRELTQRIDLDVRYVLTDLAQSQLDDWEANPQLEGFSFATYDLTAPDSPPLPDELANPLVVVANYVFDSVPADAFHVEDGELAELLVDEALTYTRRPTTADHYGDPALDALLEHYRTTLDRTAFTLPITAIATVDALRERAGGRLLLLAAEKALSTEASLAHREPPAPARHGGAFSLMVNLHALGRHADAHGGLLLHGGDRHAALDVGALVFGPAHHTRRAYAEALERFGPGDLAILADGLARARDTFDLAELTTILRLSGWDASTLQDLLPALQDKAADADPATQEDLRQALFEIHDRHFHVPGEADLPFALGVILFELEEYEEAIACFEESLAVHGPDPATEHNLARCEAMLDG
jgi:hypothetical protein